MICIRKCKTFGVSYGLLTDNYYSSQKQIKIALSSICSFSKLHTLSTTKVQYKHVGIDIDNKVKSSLRLSTLDHINLFSCQQRRYLGLAAKIVNNSPPKIKPYLKLMRMDKPIVGV